MNIQQNTRALFAATPPAPQPSGKSNRESDADYRDVIFQRGIWRVIVCKDRIQWILQKSRPDAGRPAGLRWVSNSYSTTRSGLQIDLPRLAGFDASELATFPENVNQQLPIFEVAA